jgi:serine/threonine-protein kinase
MSEDRLKDLPATVPERARLPRSDVTAVIAAPAMTAFDGVSAAPEARSGDTHFAAPSPSAGIPPSQRERLVPSAATVSSILDHVRCAPAERVEVESHVAAGGMGSIDVAVDRALDRRIAIKTLHPHLRGDETAVRMFLREARLTGLLDHPHIVPVYDLGEREGGSLFFSMKLVEGQTLASLIRSLPRGVPDTATIYMLLEVVIKVCDALAFAHSRGVIHCDIKPANVMVGEFGQVFMMDWGIARLVGTDAAPGSVREDDGAAQPEPRRESPTTDNAIIGTPCYMSPEQARGDRKHLDERSDVFLLGAMLYEVLTHRPPYVSRDRAETLALAAGGAFPSPRRVAGEAAVPLELERIVVRAMARAPGDRYPDVASLKADLVRFMRGGAEFPRRGFAAGETIVREGEPGDAAYIIVEGRCAVQKEIPIAPVVEIGPGAVFGEMAILTAGPRTATVVALEPTVVLVVTSQVLEQEMAALKPWVATLLKSLAERFRAIDTQARATFASTPGPARLANQVLMTLAVWGETDEHGGRWMKWSALAPELEAQLGVPPLALFGVVARYGLVLDIDADRLTIPDPGGFHRRLQGELAR